MTDPFVASEPIRMEPADASFEDKWWLNYGLDSLRAVVPALNDALSKLIVVDTAVIGGGLTLIDKAVMPAAFKILMLSLVGVSLCFALCGVIPYGRSVDLLDPDDIRHLEREVIHLKRDSLRLAALMLVCGFFVGIAGAGYSACFQETAAPMKVKIITE